VWGGDFNVGLLLNFISLCVLKYIFSTLKIPKKKLTGTSSSSSSGAGNLAGGAIELFDGLFPKKFCPPPNELDNEGGGVIKTSDDVADVTPMTEERLGGGAP
jgi:hypothetical protein